MEDPDLDPEETTHSNRVKKGIARARARGKRWGRPTVAEKKGDPDLAVKALELRAQGLPWSEVAMRLDISESTARRLLSTSQGDYESRDSYSVKKSVSKRLVFDTCQEDNGNKEIHCTIPTKSPIADNLETFEITEAITEARGEFIKTALQLVLENEQLTRQVLERIRTPQNVQKH